MNATTDSSAVFSMTELEFPRIGAALVEAAVMGYGVIAYERGRFFLVWWQGDRRRVRHLPWTINNCIEEMQVEVA
jgi:hypothetical protein